MSTKRKPALKPVYFEWTDACGKSGWMPPDHAEPPVVIQSIGFIMKETDEYITISPGVDTENGHYMSFVTVPKGWIKKRRSIKL